MKVVVFAGGLGTRLMEETDARPKPMVEIGGKPILWHIMKIYEHHGFNDFVICLGYKAWYIKEYFLNYYMYNSDVTVELDNNTTKVHFSSTESFKVTLIDTGLNTKTAGRLKRIQEYIGDSDFFLTYGDGLSNVNISDLLTFHQSHGKIGTVTTVQPEGRFGGIQFDGDKVSQFREKSKDDEGWINGGFFVLKPAIFDLLPENSDHIMWEDEPLEKLTQMNELMAFKHKGFWKCMDALRDKLELENLWSSNKAAWKVW